MTPYLRPLRTADAPAPCGGAWWPSRPAPGAGGAWRWSTTPPATKSPSLGRPAASVSAALAATGWRLARSDGHAVMWVRDRATTDRRRLARACAGPDATAAR